VTHMRFKDFLKEAISAITADNIRQLAGPEIDTLLDRTEFRLIVKLDPAYAKKLATAWEGDAREHARSSKFNPLFSKMVNHQNVQRLSKIKLTPQVEDALDRLLALHSQSFKKKEQPINAHNRDIWAHVEWTPEQKGRRFAYESLRVEVDAMLG